MSEHPQDCRSPTDQHRCTLTHKTDTNFVTFTTARENWSMTNPYRKPEPAIIRDLDGEPPAQPCRAAPAVRVRHIRRPTDLPGSVQAAGIRRRQHYEAATGNTTPNMLDVLAYWARHDGITLYSEDTTGHRTDHHHARRRTDHARPGGDHRHRRPTSGIVDVDQLQGDATKFM